MKKITSLLTNLKSVITNINFLYTINFLVFAALSVLSTIKLNYGILAMIVLLWTLFVIYIIITLIIYYTHSNDYDDDIGKVCMFLLVFVSICYIVTFIYMIVTKKSFTYKLKNLVAFVIILGIGIYCLVTGNDITAFIH